MDNDEYPNCFFRGVQKESDVDNGIYLKSSAFLFGSEVREEDNMKELSIIWNDNDDALPTLLRQQNKKGTGVMFEAGYATIEMPRFKIVFDNYLRDALMAYERKPLEENKEYGIEANPFHGNILLHSKVSDQIKKNIQHTLATLATFTRRS